QDGRYVAFESAADDLVANDTNGALDVFLRDLVQKTTSLISAGPTGAPGNAASLRPWMNAAGGIVLFTSAASDVVPGDYNQTTDVFVVQLAAPFLEKVAIHQGQVQLLFSTRAQRKYRVESTTDVVAGPWILAKEVTATDSTTEADLPLDGSQRFF